jgi:4-oxalocrotonate tautomerase
MLGKLGAVLTANVSVCSLLADEYISRWLAYLASFRFRYISRFAVEEMLKTWSFAHNTTNQLMCGVLSSMPVVIVETWNGKTEEQKAKLIRGITCAFQDIGVTADQVHIIIHDVPKTNWGTHGEQVSRLPPS